MTKEDALKSILLGAARLAEDEPEHKLPPGWRVFNVHHSEWKRCVELVPDIEGKIEIVALLNALGEAKESLKDLELWRKWAIFQLNGEGVGMGDNWLKVALETRLRLKETNPGLKV